MLSENEEICFLFTWLIVETLSKPLQLIFRTGTMPAWRPDSSLATPALGDSLQPYSPSPPAKSGRQSQRSSGKTRSLKGAQPAKSAPEADNTISFVLSEHLPGRKSRNGNKNGVADDKRLQSRQMREPDRSSSRIEVDGRSLHQIILKLVGPLLVRPQFYKAWTILVITQNNC